MSAVTVVLMSAGQDADMVPPPGTAIARPLRHVRAVRGRHLSSFADPAQAAASRSARAWAWALGETPLAPVTDQRTAVLPGRAEIEAEIAEADERMFRGDDDRADTAADILRWLIGEDDHVPIPVANPGELVGGFGPIVRSRDQIADTIAVAADGRSKAAVQMRDLNAKPADRLRAEQEADYLAGVIATLDWVLGNRDAPITHATSRDLTSRDLKTERLHAQDVIDQAKSPLAVGQRPSSIFGDGVKSTITWLLGHSALHLLETLINEAVDSRALADTCPNEAKG